MRAQNEPLPTVVRLVRGEPPGEPDPDVPGAFHVRRVDETALAEGRIWPQSAASQLVGLAVGSQDGERVLDLCAAPGGKTTMLRGDVVAVEIHPGRASELRENVARLGADPRDGRGGRRARAPAGARRLRPRARRRPVLGDRRARGPPRPALARRAAARAPARARSARRRAGSAPAARSSTRSAPSTPTRTRRSSTRPASSRTPSLGDEWPQFRHPTRPGVPPDAAAPSPHLGVLRRAAPRPVTDVLAACVAQWSLSLEGRLHGETGARVFAADALRRHASRAEAHRPGRPRRRARGRRARGLGRRRRRTPARARSGAGRAPARAPRARDAGLGARRGRGDARGRGRAPAPASRAAGRPSVQAPRRRRAGVGRGAARAARGRRATSWPTRRRRCSCTRTSTAGTCCGPARGWLAIDPKPLVGDPAFDVASLVRDRRPVTDGRLVERRLDLLESELGYDRERMRAWSWVHALAWGWPDEARLIRH